MAVVGAEEAGKALSTVATKLATANILSWDGQQVLEEQAGRLRKLGNVPAWGVEVDRNRPVFFNNSVDKNGAAIRISIDGARVEFQQDDEDLCPVRNMDAAVVIADAKDELIARWHIDKANLEAGHDDEMQAQPGPLFHLQFGGHVAGRRDLDLPIKEPRWCHPPLEIALLCEIVAANFFEQAWNDNVRDDESWCSAIQLFQRLCWERYLRKKLECITVSRSTALGLMWADRWPA